MRAATATKTFALAAFTAWSSVACSGDDCPTLRECDIRDASCQRRTARVVACLRGGEPPAPRVEVIDKESFIESRVQLVQQTGESPEERDVRRGLALLALMPWDDDVSLVTREDWNNVAAFFSFDTGAITVLDDGGDLDGPGAVTLLAHELTHAVQARELDAAYWEQHTGTFDESLALTGLIEGEAVLYADLANLFGYDREIDDVDWKDAFRIDESWGWYNARHTEASYARAHAHFSYAFGGAYQNLAYRAGGNRAVRTAFERPAASSREIMAGYGAVLPDERPFQDVPNEVGRPGLPQNFAPLATLHLGAWLFEAFKDVWSGPHRAFDDYSDEGFAGDVLSIVRGPGPADVTSIWRLRFERPEQADDFVSRLLARLWLKAFVRERDVIVIASTEDSVSETLIDNLTWTDAPATDSVPQAVATNAARAMNSTCVLAGKRR